MPPRTINLSITYEPIAKTFSSKPLSSCKRGEDKAKEQPVSISAPGRPERVAWVKPCPASSSLKLVQLDLVDRHSAAPSVLAQRSLLVTYSTSATKYLTESYKGEAFVLLVASEFQTALAGKA